ncbi:hypothetical protein BZM26_30965 [Paraburkholderia strydomiana]|nr:hypothetical protein BZM26_30965 [Paraburkholderia strydomiana]
MICVVQQSDSVPSRAPFARDDFEQQVAVSDSLSPAEIYDEVTLRGLLALNDHDSDANGQAVYPSICAVGDEYEWLVALEVRGAPSRAGGPNGAYTLWYSAHAMREGALRTPRTGRVAGGARERHRTGSAQYGTARQALNVCCRFLCREPPVANRSNSPWQCAIDTLRRQFARFLDVFRWYGTCQ